jgi:hypothetical protein
LEDIQTGMRACENTLNVALMKMEMKVMTTQEQPMHLSLTGSSVDGERVDDEVEGVI